MKIVIIEDEKNIREELAMLLASAGYKVVMITEFQAVARQILCAAPDLVLLDINLPEQDGNEICQELRENSDVPIIFLTSDDSVMTEVNSMLAGGDDFIAKPYHPSVLLARISAVLKRSSKQPSEEAHAVSWREVRLDLRAYRAEYRGQQVELSKNEFKLLHYLFQRKDEVVPRLDIIEHLWDNEVFIDDNALSVTVTRIRAKLEQIGVKDFIETKRGAGYKI